jgi:uncharacterized protein YkwD
VKKVPFVAALLVSLVGAGIWLTPTLPVQAAVDRTSMEAVSRAYINSFLANYNVPTGWTGSTNGCVAGTTTAAFRQSEIALINYYRDLAGLAPVTENSAATAVAQQTALMMAAVPYYNLSHTPGSDWPCYTAEGAGGAAKANLGSSSGTLGGGQAIENYMSDEGEHNVSVGHRQWILFPPQSQFGVGHTNSTDALVWGNSNGNAGMFGNPRPDGGVAWPPAGVLFPYENLPSSGRWSYSLPNYHFNSEQVSVTKNGQSIPIAIVHRETEYGVGYIPDATLVWEMPAVSTTRPAAGASDIYRISVTGQPTYEVEVFSAAQVWIDSVSITGQAQVGRTLAAQLGQVTPSAAASKVTYQWRRAGVAIEGATAASYALVAEDAGQPITVTVQVADGAYTYQLSPYNQVSFHGASRTSAQVTPTAGTIILSEVQVVGQPHEGQQLRAQAAVIPNTAALTCRWLRGSTVVGTSSCDYTVVADDLGQPLRAELTASAAGYISVTKTSTPVTPSAGTITLDSVVVNTVNSLRPVGLGQSLQGVAEHSPGDAALSWQWLRDGVAIGGADTSSYSVQALDMCRGLSVRVAAAKTGYQSVDRTSAVLAAGFTDVPVGLQFRDDICWLAQRAVTTGWANGDGGSTYGPVLPINRDAMAAFLYRFAGSPSYTPSGPSPFVDVTPSTMYYSEIRWLYELGISTGWVEGGQRYYRPLDPINRDAMAAFLYRFAGSPSFTLTVAPTPGRSGSRTPGAFCSARDGLDFSSNGVLLVCSTSPLDSIRRWRQTPFTDLSPAVQFFDEVAWLYARGITTGYGNGDGTFRYSPVSSINRDAMAAFLHRF